MGEREHRDQAALFAELSFRRVSLSTYFSRDRSLSMLSHVQRSFQYIFFIVQQ